MYALESTLVEPNAMYYRDLDPVGWTSVSRNEQIIEALHPDFGWWYWEIDKVRNA